MEVLQSLKVVLLVTVTVFGVLTVGVSSGSAPRFRVKPVNDASRLVGGSHKFRCKVKGIPKPLISWYRDNEVIIPNERIRIRKFSLEISKLTMKDSGHYACKATNVYGVLWGRFSLKIEGEDVLKKPLPTHSGYDDFEDLKGPPVFKKRLNQVGYMARAATTSAEFDCDVKAYPEATITWWKNGQQVNEKAEKYSLDDFKLTIRSLTQDDQGDYTCVVKNEYGSVNWTTKLEVQVRVAIAPVMEDIKNQTAFIGDTVTFTCKIVMSDSTPLLQWLRHFKKNDSFVNEKGMPYVKILKSSEIKGTLKDPQHLVLTNVTKEDEGWYTCLIANTVGMNFKSAWLSVESNGNDADNGTCHPNATYTPDIPVPCKCNPGYTGDGYNCTNIDECSELLVPCLEDYVCEDRDPGYFCGPQNGQKRDG